VTPTNPRQRARDLARLVRIRQDARNLAPALSILATYGHKPRVREDARQTFFRINQLISQLTDFRHALPPKRAGRFLLPRPQQGIGPQAPRQVRADAFPSSARLLGARHRHRQQVTY
jgi:hypothetical protein